MANPATSAAAGSPRRRWLVYVTAIVAGLALLIVMLSLYRSGKSTMAARQKAQQLSGKLVAAGLPAPEQDQIVRVLGSDGGAMCRDPAGALNKAMAKTSLANGAAGPGWRPVIGPKVIVTAEKLAISVYCPDQLTGFTDYVNGLTFADVA